MLNYLNFALPSLHYATPPTLPSPTPPHPNPPQVMANVFSTDRPIHETYDLKGSTYGRSAEKVLAYDQGATRKDLDLRRQFVLGKERKARLVAQVREDLKLLRKLNLMDYSLLCGVSRTAPAVSLPASPPSPTQGSSPDTCVHARLSRFLGETSKRESEEGASDEGGAAVGGEPAVGASAGLGSFLEESRRLSSARESSARESPARESPARESPARESARQSAGASDAVDGASDGGKAAASGGASGDAPALSGDAPAPSGDAPSPKTPLPSHPNAISRQIRPEDSGDAERSLSMEMRDLSVRTDTSERPVLPEPVDLAELTHMQMPPVLRNASEATIARSLLSETAPWVDERNGAIYSATEKVPEVYFIGIIDILTNFSWAKQFEAWGRVAMHPYYHNGISCKDPREYASRFARALPEWFV